MTEAAAQLRKGLELLPGIPDVRREELELELRITLGHSLMAAKGLAAPEPGEAFARSSAMRASKPASTIGDGSERPMVIYVSARGI
jgi:hypothetical protein